MARAASDALQKSFTTVEKRKALWKVYQKALIEYVEDAAIFQSAQTLSDERSTSPDDAEAKHVRVVASALSVFNTLLCKDVNCVMPCSVTDLSQPSRVISRKGV